MRDQAPPLFSIVVPVFNAESFLRDCLDSIRAQTIGDWECICVDDGSTDRSRAILEEHAARDPRFRVFHQPNGGESSARNAALEKVSGSWFLFIDSDDAIVPDALDCFRRALDESGADALLCFPEDRFLDISNYRDAPAGYRMLASGQRPIDMLAGPLSAHGYTVSKVYRSTLFKSVRFPVGVRITPDTRFWADALCVPAAWAVIEKPYYAYRKHPGAATATKDFRFFRECLESYGYVFRTMAGPMGASVQDIARYATRYRSLHSHMLFNAFRPWRTYTEDERHSLLETTAGVCATSPVFPFRWTTRLRLLGRRFGCPGIAVPVANFLDRAALGIKYRWHLLQTRLGLAGTGKRQ